ncbi:MAG: HEAT repeat domain-containing protein [Desulfomonile tiedjei]|nr:HEAT repeat domain-containing protein [Desulfomonile tiedjei]
MWRLLRQVTGSALLLLLTVTVTAASTVDWYIRQLRDKDPELRAETARAMAVGTCCRPLRAVPPLVQALSDPEWKVREAAAEALGYFSAAADQVVPRLLERLSDQSVDVRRAVILSLGRLRADSEEIRQALTQFASDADADIRTNLIIASALLGRTDDSAIPILVTALGSKSEPTSEAAGTALKECAGTEPHRIIPTLVEALKSSDERVVANVVKLFQELLDRRDWIIPELSGVYDEVDPRNRALVLQTVAQMDEGGDYALPLCVRALADSDAAVRKEALEGAMRYESSLDKHVGPIIQCLKDAEDENLLLAIGIVKRLDHKAVAAVPGLIALTRQGSTAVRVEAVSALRIFTPPSGETLEALDEALRDKNEEVRNASANTLRAIKRRYPSGAIDVPERAAELGQGNAPRH